MKKATVLLTCLVAFMYCRLALASEDIAIFTFKDNTQQKVRLSEPKCNIKSISFVEGDTKAMGTSATPPAEGIDRCIVNVQSAKYGLNCNVDYEVARVERDCRGKSKCEGIINNDYAGNDPAPGCFKDFTIGYACGNTAKSFYVPARQGEGGHWALMCCDEVASPSNISTVPSNTGESPPVGTHSGIPANPPLNTPITPAPGMPTGREPATIKVLSAIYAANCKASYPVRRVADECNGKASCHGIINNDYAGNDPAPGCFKDFTIRYSCGSKTKTAYVPARQEEGGSWHLDCP